MEISAALIEEILFWRVRMVETTLMASQLKISERVNFFFLFFFLPQSEFYPPERKKQSYFIFFYPLSRFVFVPQPSEDVVANQLSLCSEQLSV